MRSRRGIFLGTSLLFGSVVLLQRHASAQVVNAQVVRIAELAIDPAQIEHYRAALREEIETSIRIEPGMLALYAVAVKGHPEQIRLFEIYADAMAYEAHLLTPHFRRYKAQTEHMVQSLKLVETEPVLLGAKSR